jgi:hypothetical protein
LRITEKWRITAPCHDGHETIECRAKRRISSNPLVYRCKHLLRISHQDSFQQPVFITEFTVKTWLSDFSAPTNLIQRDAFNVFAPVRLHRHRDDLFAIRRFGTPS